MSFEAGSMSGRYRWATLVLLLVSLLAAVGIASRVLPRWLRPAPPALDFVSSFVSEVKVSSTGVLTITETVTIKKVDQESEARFKRGVWRQLNGAVADHNGAQRKIVYTIQGATYNDIAIKPEVSQNGSITLVRLTGGEAELPLGEHKFALTYQATGALVDENGFILFDWDPAGFWKLPIKSLRFDLYLPGSVSAKELKTISWRLSPSFWSKELQAVVGPPADLYQETEQFGRVRFLFPQGIEFGETVRIRVLFPKEWIRSPP